MTRFKKDGHATSFLDPWPYSELVSYCSWSFRKLSKHSLVGHRRDLDLCWRKAHLCLSGGSLCVRPPGQTAAAAPGMWGHYGHDWKYPSSLLSPHLLSNKALARVVSWFLPRLCFSHCGMRCHDTLLVFVFMDWFTWLCNVLEGWPAGLLLPNCVPGMLWLTLKRQLLCCIWPSILTIGGSLCRGVVGQTWNNERWELVEKSFPLSSHR